MHDALHQLRAGQPGEHFQPREVPHDVRMGQQIAAAQTGRNGLGKAAHVDHTRKVVQAGQRGAGLGVQVAVDVVLHQQHVVLLRQTQHLVQLLHGGHRAGRAVESRLGEKHLGPQPHDHVFQRGQVPAIGRSGCTVRPHAHKAQGVDQIGVARLVHQHHIARPDQPAHRQVQRLTRALGQQHLVWLNVDGVLAHTLADPGAQGRVAQRVAVIAQGHGVRRSQRTHGPSHAIFKQPALRQPAAAGLVRQMVVFEDALQIPAVVKTAGGQGRRRFRDGGLHRSSAGANEKPRVQPGYHIA